MRLPLLVSNKLTHLRFFAIAALVAFVGDARGQGTQASANGSSESSSDPTAQVTPEQLQFFETKIRPVLVESCYRCHSNEGQGFRGGLSVANREGLLAGGESGAAIVPGNLEESLLWNAINYRDFRMPPRGRLPDKVLEDFKTWIEMGAPDPRNNDGVVVRSKVTPEDIEKGKSFWSFQKPKPTTPELHRFESWPISSIDRFVASRWESNELEPNEDCDPNTLLRRITFDLIGLPPTAQQRSSFVETWSLHPQRAIDQLVDSLLDSPQYGERWGRHWLDVARYAESSGKESDVSFPNAWRYRDYVIKSFQQDKPYDRFVIEQIAGDLLPVSDDQQWNENLIATGFLAMGPKSLTEQNPRQFQADLVDEQIDATTRVVLGLSVACARCHDHKFDPIPQSDYYALAGIFQSTESYFGGTRSVRNRQPSDWIKLPVQDTKPMEPSISPEDLADLKKELAERRQELVEARRQQRSGTTNPPGLNPVLLEQVVSQLVAKVNSVDASGRPISFCMGVQDRESPRNARVLVRGEIDQPAQEVERGFVQVLGNLPQRLPSNASGRLEFAKWLVSKENPLTARVMVNRVWQHLLGQGLVREPDNFGVSGPEPTHPELLDHLAIQFMEQDWSIKRLIRSIVTSRVYRLSSAHQDERFESDPENRWLTRANVKRLDAEAVRDAMLAVSGLIDTKPPRASIIASFGVANMGPNGPINIPLIAPNMGGEDERAARLRRLLSTSPFRNQAVNLLDLPNYHRSVYLPVARNNLPRALDAFDFADPSMVVGTREVSNTASQALFMLNNPFVLELSDAFARKVLRSTKDNQGRIEQSFQMAFGRAPTKEELQVSLRYIKKAKESQVNAKPDEALFQALSQFCQALFGAAEFRILN